MWYVTGIVTTQAILQIICQTNIEVPRALFALKNVHVRELHPESLSDRTGLPSRSSEHFNG